MSVELIRSTSNWWHGGLFVALLVTLIVPGLAADRYVAMFADGTRVESPEIRDWNEPNSIAKIAERTLLNSTSPVRWILDRSHPIGADPFAYIEFAGGDRLVGEVVSFRNGQENPFELHPPYLIVKPATPVHPPTVPALDEIYVTTTWIQRIVWENADADDLKPGTLRLRTGTSLSFRSMRWTSTGATVLTGDGVKEFAIAELSEIHFPRLDPWTAYCEQAAILSPDLNSRLIQLNSSDGSRWTTSAKRFQCRSLGDRNRPDQWHQLIQPAWSLRPIWLRFRTIREWRFFLPTEVPLSNFAPSAVSHDAVFGQALDWQADKSVLRERLQSIDKEFGWGIGVHGTTELTFDLPGAAEEFRTKFGLDRAAGTGGGVNVEIMNGIGQSLFTRPYVVGANAVGDVDWTSILGDQQGRRRITLRTEMAHAGRPDGADPFDVRDIFNWYEPEVRLNASAFDARIRTRGIHQLAGLMGWTISPDDLDSLRIVNALDATDPHDPQFRIAVRSTQDHYTLTKKIKVGEQDSWLAIVANRLAHQSSSSIRVRIDAADCGEFDIPVQTSITDPAPILVPVSQFQGRTVSVAVSVTPADADASIDWKGFSVGIERPGVLTIFEDDETFANALNSGNGRVRIEREQPYSGRNSISVTPTAGDNAKIAGLEAQICEFPRLGQYRYLVFAWKKSTGTRIQLQLAERGSLLDGQGVSAAAATITAFPYQLGRRFPAEDRGRRFRYGYEEGLASTQPRSPLWMHGELPRKWQLIERDLFQDFGSFVVTGIFLNCFDGDEAWFDHIYLARSKEDVEYLSRHLINPE